jgi:NAD(P)-dependent dehydrogenase (short-subunit alcohol dehydrogenase family)
MGQIDGQFVIIAGHASSLRDAAATRLKAEGAEVAIVEPTAEAVAHAAEKAGRLDALVNVLNSGTSGRKLSDGNASEMRGALDQVAAFADTMRAAYPWLKLSQGRIANVCSVYGSTALTGLSDNVTADSAILGLTRSVGAEMARDGIRVNSVVPGALDVPETRELRERHAGETERRVRGIALHRLGDPVEDFGGALMMLLSDEWCFMVGHPVHADGGQHLAAPVAEPAAPYASA